MYKDAHQVHLGDKIDGKLVTGIEYYDTETEWRIIFTFEDGTTLDVEEYESV